MEEEMTSEQKEKLLLWSNQRDALLSEIAVLADQKGKLLKDNAEITASSIDTAQRIEQAKGRMAELDEKEADYISIVSAQIPDLLAEKARLEATITGLKK